MWLERTKRMSDLDVLLETDSQIYENEYMIVKKVLFEIPTQSSNWVKRVQIVNWKMKGSSKDELDIRRFSVKDNQYQKGISFTKRELSVLLENLSKLNEFSESLDSE